jgi:hypothetical protein
VDYEDWSVVTDVARHNKFVLRLNANPELARRRKKAALILRSSGFTVLELSNFFRVSEGNMRRILRRASEDA